MADNEEEQLKQKYMQFQMLQQQIEELGKHLEMFTEQNAELEITINAIKEVGNTKLNNEILTPIANGIFIKSELKDNKKLIVNVGSDTTVEKTVPEVVKLLEQQKEEVSKKIMETDTLLQEFSNQAMKIYKEMEGKVQ